MTPINWVIGVSLYAFILVFWNKNGLATVQEAFYICGNRNAVLLTGTLWPTYLYYARSNGGIEWKVATFVLCYYLWPTLLLWPTSPHKDRLAVKDCLVLSGLWVPLIIHFWPVRSHATVYDKPLILLSALTICVTSWIGKQQVRDAKLNFRFSFRDSLVTLGILFGLVALLFLLGIELDFIALPPVKRFHALGFALAAAQILIGTAFFEEFFARGILQNLLEKRLKNTPLAVVCTSLVFGLGHLSYHVHSWNPENWNWTLFALAIIAGVGYGTIFRLTSSILYAMFAHALIDAIWGLFK